MAASLFLLLSYASIKVTGVALKENHYGLARLSLWHGKERLGGGYQGF